MYSLGPTGKRWPRPVSATDSASGTPGEHVVQLATDVRSQAAPRGAAVGSSTDCFAYAHTQYKAE